MPTDETQSTLQWPQTIDASVWAKQWMRAFTADPLIAADEATMLGWFANAIMAGYDEAQRRAEREGGAA